MLIALTVRRWRQTTSPNVWKLQSRPWPELKGQVLESPLLLCLSQYLQPTSGSRKLPHTYRRLARHVYSLLWTQDDGKTGSGWAKVEGDMNSTQQEHQDSTAGRTLHLPGVCVPEAAVNAANDRVSWTGVWQLSPGTFISPYTEHIACLRGADSCEQSRGRRYSVNYHLCSGRSSTTAKPQETDTEFGKLLRKTVLSQF